MNLMHLLTPLAISTAIVHQPTIRKSIAYHAETTFSSNFNDPATCSDSSVYLCFSTTPEMSIMPPLDFNGVSSFTGTYVVKNANYPNGVPITKTQVTDLNPDTCTAVLVDNDCLGITLQPQQECHVNVQVTSLINAGQTSCTSQIQIEFPVRGSPLTDQFTLVALTTTPSLTPTAEPSLSVTVAPSVNSPEPTIQPTNVEASFEPSMTPTSLPTIDVSLEPSAIPTGLPTIETTFKPFIRPTPLPTIDVSLEPSARPTGSPSFKRSDPPTNAPLSSASPSLIPTSNANLSIHPSMPPSLAPTAITHAMDDDPFPIPNIIIISIVLPVGVAICLGLAALGCCYYQKQKSRNNGANKDDECDRDLNMHLLEENNDQNSSQGSTTWQSASSVDSTETDHAMRTAVDALIIARTNSQVHAKL